ncbi:MAG: tetratricopeptide repeat protein [Elusimicrobia bacterium]|nr:tetratricopeptide repeat protein [Elusimicrobiota bacterium]
MRRHARLAGLLAALILAAYAVTLRNGFVGDDHIYVEGNPFVQSPRNLRVLLSPRFYLGTHEVLVGERPVFLGSLLVDRALWGGRPGGYHLTSAVLHAANAVLVFALALGLGLAPAPAFLGTLLFGLHPAATEAVNAVSFRADLLSTLFLLTSLLLYLRAREAPPRRDLALVGGAAAAFGLALLSKEMAASLPFLIVAVEYLFPAPRGRLLRGAVAFAAFAVVGCAYAGFWSTRFHYGGMETASAMRSAAERIAAAMPTAPGPGSLLLGLERGHIMTPSAWEWNSLFADRAALAATMARAAFTYLGLLVFPLALAVDRAPVVAAAWRDPGALAGAAGLLALAAAAVALRRRRPGLAFAAVWCLAALLPVSNVIPLYNPVAERYLYLAAAAVALAAAWAAEAAAATWPRRRSAGALELSAPVALGLVVAAAFGARTVRRNLDWRDDRSLYFSATRGTPQNSGASLVRGNLFLEEGKFREAADQFLKGIERRPAFTEAWLGLARAYAGLGDAARAEESFLKAESASPKDPAPRAVHAMFLAATGADARAVDKYREAVALEPAYTEAWVNLGALYRDNGKFDDARVCYERALRTAAPQDALPEYAYGTMLEKKGDREGALAHYRAALARNQAFEPARRRIAGVLGQIRREHEARAASRRKR